MKWEELSGVENTLTAPSLRLSHRHNDTRERSKSKVWTASRRSIRMQERLDRVLPELFDP